MLSLEKPSSPVELVLSSLQRVKRQGRGWAAQCPAHDDQVNSLFVSEGDDGRALVKCFAGCSLEAIVEAVDLEARDLFASPAPSSCEPLDGTHSNPVTVDQLAQDKALPADFLRRLGLVDRSDGVLVPYHSLDGSLAPRQRLRTALRAKDGSLWVAGKGRPVPYGLEKLVEARREGYLVLVEGESDAWTLWHHNIPALGIPGAVMYRKLELEHTSGIARLYVIHEPDHGGDTFARGVARRLGELRWKGEAFQVRFSNAKDVNDLHRQGPEAFNESFQAALGSAEPLPLESPREKDRTRRTQNVPGQTTILLNLAESVELFHDPNHNAYASFQVGQHWEMHPIRGKSFRRFLTRAFYHSQAKPPNSQALQDTLGVLEARGCYDGPTQAIFPRIAEHAGKCYLDLANEQWEAMEISSEGWRVVSRPPVRFRRTRGMLPLPHPVPGGSITELRGFVNLGREADWQLFLAWLLSSLRPAGPFPVLVLSGEHGSAKSTAVRIARSLCDPNTAPLRAEPREVRDLMIAAANSWCLAFDNVSHLPPWLSDAICRLATGGGFATRELYTDVEEVLFESQRPVVINGIEEVVTRSDLVDRSLILFLPEIEDRQRRSEREFWDEFESARPRILGALLDIVVVALREMPRVKLAEKCVFR